MQSLPPIVEEGTSSDDESFGTYDEQSARQSGHQDASFHAPPSSLPPPVPLYTPFPILAVSKFLTDDDGASLIEDGDGDELPDEAVAVESLPSAPASSSSTLRLSRTRSGSSSTTTSTITPSTSRIARVSSLFSVDSVAQHFTARAGEKSFQLADFCKLIDAHPSLERAKILSVECYKEPIRFGVVHRTLIFHLRRERRTDIWMRVDRRRSRDVPFRVFAMRGGRTEANDVALLAGAKADLLNRRSAVLENQMEFEAPPNLGVFRFCLQVICEELLEYHIWPENCWFMCSLLQEHLFETGQGLFRRGSPIRLNLAPRIRVRVRNRVWHVVTASSSPDGPHIEKETPAPSSVMAVRWKTLDGGVDTLDFDGQALDNYLDSLAETLSQHHQTRLDNLSRDALVSISTVARRALALEFLLLQRHPMRVTPRVVGLLTTIISHLPRTDSLALVISFSTLVGGLHKNSPEIDDDTTAARLLRIARACEPFDAAAARAYITEARAVASTHWEAQRHWTSSQKLRRGTSGVNCVAFSPDGKQIVSASSDAIVCRWGALTGESIGEPMQGHTNSVITVAFSPDGTQIISGSSDCTLRRWDALSGEPIGAPMRGHTGFVMSVAYSPDGKFIVSSSNDYTIRRWDASTGETVGEPLKGHTDYVRSVACSPDGKRIVSGSSDQTVRLWDAITSEAVGEPWNGHTSWVRSVAFSPDGRFIVSGSFDTTVRRWNALTGEMSQKPEQAHGRP